MAPTLRPLSVGELLDRTFTFYRRRFVLFVGIAAIPSAVALAFQVGRLYGAFSTSVATTVVLGLVSLIVSVVTGTFVHGATVVAVSQLQLEQDTNIAEAFAAIRPLVGELFIIGLNVGVRVMLGLLLLIVPGIILALSYSVAVPVAILEGTTVSESLTRSSDLTRGGRGRIFVIYCLFFVLTMVGGAFWPVITGAIAAARSVPLNYAHLPMWAQLVSQFGAFVTQSLIGPITTIALTLVYYDQRVRKEAFDLQHMMDELDASPQST
ncbi:MAG TPA: hypothetical protein VGG73_10625 [Vicinamibacterales bacterium]